MMITLYFLVVFLIAIFFCLRRYLRGPIIISSLKERLDGKFVVITGGNDGIGKETAKELMKRGANVTICCRNMKKASEVMEEFAEFTSVKYGGSIRAEKLNLASLKSVRDCCKKLSDSLNRIDILINNAGIMACPYWITEDGFEMQMGTNHLGHFLFTELLLPKLKESVANGYRPRIIIVSSIVHRLGKIHWDNLNWEKDYNPYSAYWQSKLANILHARELSRRYNETMSVYSLHPGVIASNLARHMEKYWYGFTLPFLYYPFIKTPFYGAQTTLYVALEPSIALHSGRYYSDCRETCASSQAINDENAQRLWSLSEKLVGI